MVVFLKLVGLILQAATAASGFQLRIFNNQDKAATNGPFDDGFEKLVNKTLESWKVPGLAIAVVDGDDTWAQGYGIATFPSTPATSETLWMGASTTKAFTAAAMSFLVNDNENYSQIQWDTPISQIIRDDFVLEDGHITKHVSIEDALSHRTGMPRHDLSYGGDVDGHKSTNRDLYCNMMYVVASYVIETVTGSSLEDVIRSRILKPLDMRSTYFDDKAARKAPEHFATGYYYSNGSYHEVPDLDVPDLSGAGFVISNVLDYAKWIRAMIDQTSPISEAGYKALRKPRMLEELGPPYTGPVAYTLGWFTGVYQGYEWFQHSGGLEAFGSNVIFFPELRYGLVAFGNIASSSNIAEVALQWHLIDEKLGVPKERRFDWNKKYRDQLNEKMKSLQNAKSTFYPSLPDPPLPLSLDLSSYTGTYFNSGYKNINITMPPSSSSSSSSSSLHIHRADATLKVTIDLEHVSGEYFLGQFDLMNAPDVLFRTAFPAEFRLGKDGKVREFGALLEQSMGEEKIWFTRI